MKKIYALLLALVVCLSASLTVYAANDAALSVKNVKAERNDYVYVSVVLEDCEDANTLSIKFEYDSSVLKKLPNKCTWTEVGTLSEFSINKDEGIWYNGSADGFDGEICKLGFRVTDTAAIGETTVTCTVIAKDENRVVYEGSAVGKVEVTCAHVAANDAVGTKVNDTTHKYNCANCDTEVTEDHIWDKGIVTKPATEEETGIKEYTCTFCKATKTEELPKLESDDDEGDEPGGDTPGGDEPGGDEPGGDEPGGDEPGGDEPGGSEDEGNQGGTTKPEVNKPTKPVTKPETNKPNNPNQGGTTTPETEVVDPDDTQEPETEDVDTPDDEVDTEKPGNDDVPSGSNGGNAGPIIGVIGVIAAIAAGAFFFLKRK